MKKIIIAIVLLVFIPLIACAQISKFNLLSVPYESSAKTFKSDEAPELCIFIKDVENLNVYEESASPSVGQVNKGDVYPLIEIRTVEVTSTVFYRFEIDNKYAWINSYYAEIFPTKRTENVNKYEKYLNGIKSISELKHEYDITKNNIEKRNISGPISEEIMKMPLIMRKNYDLRFKLTPKNIEPYVKLYDEIKSYTLNKIEKIEMPKYYKAITILSMIDMYPKWPTIDYGNVMLARQGYELFKYKKSAEELLLQMSLFHNSEDEKYVDEILELMDKNPINYIRLGQYYNGLKNYPKAIGYLYIAKNVIRGEGDKIFYDIIGKPLLAKCYEETNDYANAASIYLELEAESGGKGDYAFEAAYNANITLQQGIKVLEIDRYKIIELYKRSGLVEGYYNAGLMYIEMDSPRNARMIADIIKKKFKDNERANFLLDEADKLDAKLKGHNID